MTDPAEKWAFSGDDTADYFRRYAIEEEAAHRWGWIKHVVWAAAFVIVALAMIYGQK